MLNVHVEEVEKLRVAFFISNSLSINGGFEKVLTILTEFLDVHSASVVFFVLTHDKEQIPGREDWLPIFKTHKTVILRYEFPETILSRVKNRFGAFELQPLSESFPSDYDIAIVVFPHFIQPVRRFLHRYGIDAEVVGWFHNSFSMYTESKSRLRRFLKTVFYQSTKLLKKQLTGVRYVLCISSGIEREVRKAGFKGASWVVFNPVLENSFVELEPIKRSKEVVFAYVGRIDDNQKNLRFMLRALSKLNFPWRLKLIGTGPDEEMLKRYIDKIGIINHIEWLGFSREPFELLRSDGVTALLLTSRFEGLPTVLIEAISYGIPVIAANCKTGPEDIIVQGVNGYLFRPGNEKNFINVLHRFVNGQLKVGTAQEMRETVKKFVKEAVCERIYEILRYIVVNK